MITIRAITIKNPFGPPMVTGVKNYETGRNWRTQKGVCLIHAGKAKVDNQSYKIMQRPDVQDAMGPFYPMGYHPEGLHYGAIIGAVNFAPAIPLKQVQGVTELESALGYFHRGKWVWPVNACGRFEQPIPASGQLGIWSTQVPTEAAFISPDGAKQTFYDWLKQQGEV